MCAVRRLSRERTRRPLHGATRLPIWAAKSLLFDENPGSAHVVEFELLERPDREIRDFAQTSGFIIVTTDADFYELACSIGPAPESAVAPPVGSSDAGC